MDIINMRQYVKDAYGSGRSKRWCEKVDKMHDNQVIAIYYNLLNRNKKKVEPKKPEITKEEKPKETNFHQITIDEYLHRSV